tara:strand:- start:18288 stop:19103 length:816 start_codon:yes stop_codon:yes gene_type:complete
VRKKTINKNIEFTSKRKLSIQFSLDGFSFCTTNVHDEVYEFSSFSFLKAINSPELILKKLKEIFKEEKSLQEEFQTVTVIHQNNLSTLVPNEYFKEDALKDYLKYSIKTIATDLIVYDDLNFMDSKNVYVPYVNINNFLFQNFGEFEYKHHSSLLLEKLFLQSKTKLGFYVNVSPSMFDIVVIKNSKLLFFNVFEYHTKEDFIYFILFTLEQLELSTEDTVVSILGDIKENSDLFNILYTYVRNINLLNSKNAVFNDQKDFSKHSNFILLG